MLNTNLQLRAIFIALLFSAAFLAPLTAPHASPLGLRAPTENTLRAPAQKTDQKPVSYPQETQDRIQKADQCLKNRGNPAELDEGLKLLRALHQQYPSDRDIGWKLAMATYSVGFKMPPERKEERKNLFEEGRNAGLKATVTDPNCAACHFWTAINHVLLGSEQGIFSSVSGLKKVREHARRVIELDEGYAYGGAHRLLAQIDRALPGVLGGSNSRAKEHFESAIRVAPDEPMNYYELSRLLANELKEPLKALEIAKKGLNAGPLSPERIEGLETQKLLLQWIPELEKRIQTK
jgi:hypothetical protein